MAVPVEDNPLARAVLYAMFMGIHHQIATYEKALKDEGYPQSTIDLKIGEARMFYDWLMKREVSGYGPRQG